MNKQKLKEILEILPEDFAFSAVIEEDLQAQKAETEQEETEEIFHSFYDHSSTEYYDANSKKNGRITIHTGVQK